MADYNPIELKEYRLRKVEEAAQSSKSRWVFIRGDIADKPLIDELFATYRFHVRVMRGAPEKQNSLPIPPYAVYNIGGGLPENLLDYITSLQEELVRAGVLPPDYDFDAHKSLVPMQPGDVPITYADSTVLERDYGFRPEINIRQGLRAFAEWYKTFYMS